MSEEATEAVGTVEEPATEAATPATEEQSAPAETQETESKGTLLAEEGEKEELEGAPESYEDFELPEDMEIDTGLLEQAVPVFKELGLPQDKAQKLVSLYAAARQSEAKASHDSLLREQKEWKEASRAHAEFGGSGFDENLGAAKRALDQFATPGFVEILNKSGYGDHPDVIHTFWKIGQLIAEDKPGDGGKGPDKDLEMHERWYPTQVQQTN